MTPAPPLPTSTLYQFTFAHLPNSRREPSSGEWRWKVFGFFDQLRIDPLKHVVARPSPHAERHQRTLLAYGDESRVNALLNRASSKNAPCYLAVCLIRLAGEESRGQYYSAVSRFIATKAEVVYLGCLDAPDVIVLATFGGQSKPPTTQPLRELITWMEKLRSVGPLKDRIDRSLTFVACRSLAAFISKLAYLDQDSAVRALVRLTDMDQGRALPKLRKSIQQQIGTDYQLYSSVGYYDVHAMVPMGIAAKILQISDPLVESKRVTTSTGILGIPDFEPKTGNLRVDAASGIKPLLKSLGRSATELRDALRELEEAWCLNPFAQDFANEAIEKFIRLDGTGFIPGSQQLLWTCRDAVSCFARECRDHLRRRVSQNRGNADADFHRRQGFYGKFFLELCNELNRLVSLSLPAYTRFFPSAIEAPLKVIGALDIAGRLVASSFRSYRCREKNGILQVFTTSWEKPSQFFPYHRPKLGWDGRPFATMVITQFSPRMVHHFCLALFSVFHETAQSILLEVVKEANFTSLVFSQAFVERFAGTSTLVSSHRNRVLPDNIPSFMRDWAAEFLTIETAITERKVFADLPWCFATEDVEFSDRTDPKSTWIGENVWMSQVEAWNPRRVTPRDDAPQIKALQMLRDSSAVGDLERLIDSEDTRAETAKDICDAWAQRLYVSFGLKAISRKAVAHKAGNAKEPAQSDRHIASTYGLEIKNWVTIWQWHEYLELASLVPFLRLFMYDADTSDLQPVIHRLLCDYLEVWNDSEEPSLARCWGRRFAVALAALMIFQKQRNRDDLGNCIGDAADAQIKDSVQKAAGVLLHLDFQKRDRRATGILRQIWIEMRNPKRGSEEQDPSIRFAHPILVNAMVRFLVRLMHVYFPSGEMVLNAKESDLREVDRHLRRVFVSSVSADGESIPASQVSMLWAFHYRLTQRRGGEIDYLFSLRDALGAKLES